MATKCVNSGGLLLLGNISGYCNTVQNRNLLKDITETVVQLKERYSTESVIIGAE